MSETLVNVAIVGCGRIGSRWDAEYPSGGPSLTHAAAFSRDPRASLVAMCDADAGRAAHAAHRWGAQRSYSDVRALFAAESIDLAVIATSSAARWDVVEPALAAGVRVLVIEKPLATTVAECRRLAMAIESAGATAIVNYSRHWDPAMTGLRTAIAAGELGRLHRLVGTYGKGLDNNGSHMIDLAGFLCGARPVRVRARASPLDPAEAAWSRAEDPSLDAEIIYVGEKGEEYHLTLLGTDHTAFTCFELRLIGGTAVAEMRRGGRDLRLHSIIADPNYPGYRIPGPALELPSRYLEAMDHMADEALRLALGAPVHPACGALTALRTAQTVEAAKRSSRADGRWTDVDAATTMPVPEVIS